MTRINFKRISWFWYGLLVIIITAAALRLLSYQFSLPYVSHLDEPNYYLAGLEWRGLYDNQGYYNGVPPAYIALHTVLQPVLESLGIQGLAETVRVFRIIAILANLGTLIAIAAAARLAAGDMAGLIAGALWGLSPIVLEQGIYALPDPLIYFFTALALWLALVALLRRERAFWSVWSIVAGLLATLLKYPAVPALLPGGLVALFIIGRDRRRGLQILLIQAILVAAVGLWLVFIYGVDFNNLQREGAIVRNEGLTNLINLNRLIHNIRFSFIPLHEGGVIITFALGAAAWLLATRFNRKRIAISAIGITAAAALLIPWLTNTYAHVTSSTIRYVLPATTLVCVLVGIAIAQIIHLLPPQRKIWGQTAVWAAFALVIGLPQLNADWQLVMLRRIPDRRVELRQWVDINLDPGTVIVYRDNHKTFNPFWGGIPYRHWVDWWITENIMEHPVAEWRDQRGMSYAAIDRDEWERMQTTPEGRAYLDELFHLRDFIDPPVLQGPQVIFYRLWKPDVETTVRFGESILLTGYDESEMVVSPGDTMTFRFYWNAPTSPSDNYSLFLHLTSLDHPEPIAQADGSPGVLERPTLTWNIPDETLISPRFELTVPNDLPPGEYQIRIGLYNYLTNVRLPVSGADGSSLGDFYTLGKVVVSG